MQQKKKKNIICKALSNRARIGIVSIHGSAVELVQSLPNSDKIGTANTLWNLTVSGIGSVNMSAAITVAQSHFIERDNGNPRVLIIIEHENGTLTSNQCANQSNNLFCLLLFFFSIFLCVLCVVSICCDFAQ